MEYSLMAKMAEEYFRRQPKPTEAEYDARLRARLEQPEKRGLPPETMGGRRETGPDGDLFWFNEGSDDPYTIFYCHGGSYIHDFSYFHWRFLRKLMDRTGAAVMALGYRLAPYGTWEDAFRLFLPAYTRYASAHPKRKLILMGDSAGGGLAAALALELDRLGERAPDELILLSPCRACGRWWAGSADVRDPRVSPGFGPVERLRHVTIFAGTRELLNPDSVKLYERLDPAGDNELIIGEGMFHVYPLLPIPEARPAVRKIVETITRERSE